MLTKEEIREEARSILDTDYTINGESVDFMEDCLIELLEKDRPRWIPVAERLPADSENVLLAHASEKYKDKVFMAVSCYDSADGGGWFDALTSDPLIPIAWMPLPEPPKQAEK